MTEHRWKPYTPAQERFGEWFIKTLGRMQVWVYEKSDGRLWNTFLKAPCAILTTTGRKSGEPRKTPLLYMEDGDQVVMVASKGGMSRAPLWYRNIQANPRVCIQIGARRRDMEAREATPDEEIRLWPMLQAIYPGYAEYRARCEGVRHIPILIFSDISA